MACYVIAHITVNNPDAYSGYTAETPGTVAQFGGRFVVRGGASTAMEGEMPGRRTVVIEFPDRTTAEAWYNSPEYQKILPIRHANSTGAMIIVDGHDG